MKNLTTKLRLASLLSLVLLAFTAAYGQLTPSGDSYINTATATTNYGAKTLLDVQSSSQTIYIQFDLSAIPSGYTGANVTKASLKLYVNAVTTAGSFNVDYVNGAWSESTIDANNAPALGTTIAASVPLTTKDKNQYILVDITPAVQAWLNGTELNYGIALVGNSPLNASFDSKENTTTSHPAELDIVFTNVGGITGITTASGSGLIGGGTSGTLNLSLLTTCSSGQILAWNGSAWACKTVSGTGTVTSVGSGLGLTGGPITTSGTLSVDTTTVPLLSAYNSFTSGQSITATGNVDGLDSVSNGVNYNGILGLANATTGNGNGVFGIARSATGYGVVGADYSSAGLGTGVYGTSPSGIGVSGNSTSGVGVYGNSTGGGLAGFFNGNVQLTGKITSYNNSATVANGVPSIILQLQTFSGGGGISNTNLFTPANDGIFRITAFQECTGASAGISTFVLSFSWTVPASGSPNALGFGQVTGGGCGGSFASYASGSIVAHVQGGTAIQYNYPGMDAPFQTIILIEQLL